MFDLFQIFLLLTISITCLTLICSARNYKEPPVVNIEEKTTEKVDELVEKIDESAEKVDELVEKIDESAEKLKIRNEKIAIIRRRLKPKAASSSQAGDSCV